MGLLQEYLMLRRMCDDGEFVAINELGKKPLIQQTEIETIMNAGY